MARIEMKDTGIDLDKFPYEKAELTRAQVESVLQKACDNNFDFNITKGLNPVQIYTSLLFHNINCEKGRKIFNADLYFSDKITVMTKRLILNAYAKRGNAFVVPRNVADVFHRLGPQRTYATLKARFDKENFTVDDKVMTEHVSFEHTGKELTGGRIIQRQKFESNFLENPKDLAKEVLRANVEQIANWMASPRTEDLVLTHNFDRQIGEGLNFNFCKVNCKSATIVLKKDNALEKGERISRNANKNPLGFIIKTFYPPVAEAELTGERISYKELQKQFKNITYTTTPLYRTFAIAKEKLDKDYNATLGFYSGSDGQYGAINATFLSESGDTITARVKNNRVDYYKNGQEATLLEICNTSKRVYTAIGLIEDCLEEQKKIGIKAFESVLDKKNIQEVTYDGKLDEEIAR